MKKILSIFTVLFTVLTFAQNTNPYLQPNSSPTSGQWNQGALKVDSVLVVPSRTRDSIYTNPILGYKGRIQLNSETDRFEHHNEFGWVENASNSFNFNNINVPYGSVPLVAVNPAGFDAGIREIGNVIYDDEIGKHIMVYSGHTLPYAETNVHIGLATRDAGSDEWVKVGQITFTPSEDPYLVKHNGTYYLFCERKDGSLTYKHAGIELFTATDIEGTWTSQGIVFDKTGTGWEFIDVSSPVVKIINDVWYLYYEGRGSIIAGGGTMTNEGAIGMATSSDGLAWTRPFTGPIISGFNMNSTVPWASTIVPDDIEYNNGVYYMTAHADGGYFSYVTAILESTDLEQWSDYLKTYATIPLINDESGSGTMFYNNIQPKALVCVRNTSQYTNGIYEGYLTNNPSNNWQYTVRVTANAFSKLTSKSKNEVIEANISGNTTWILGDDPSGGKGVNKIIRNPSIYTLTIDPDTNTTIDGSGSNVAINAGEWLWICSTGLNSWKTIYSSGAIKSLINAKQDVLVSGTNIKTVGGISLLGSGDVGAILQGGNAFSAPVVIGSTDNQIVSFINYNGVNANTRAQIEGVNFQIASGGSLQLLSGSDIFRLDVGQTNGLSANMRRNQSDSSDIIWFSNEHTSSTGGHFRLRSNIGGVMTQVGGTRKDGAFYTSATADSNDELVPLGQMNMSLSAKQDLLVSGTNIKTVGGTSLLGSGDVSEIDNNLTASTTRGASKTAINTALALKADLTNPVFSQTIRVDNPVSAGVGGIVWVTNNIASASGNKSQIRFGATTAWSTRYAYIDATNDGSNNHSLDFYTNSGGTMVNNLKLSPNGSVAIPSSLPVASGTYSLLVRNATGGVLNTLTSVPATLGGTGMTSGTAGYYNRWATSTTMEQRTPSQVLSDIGGASDASVVHNTGAETVAGQKTLTSSPIIQGATGGIFFGPNPYHFIGHNNTFGGIYITPAGTGNTNVTSGNFGINQASPTEKLDVIGNAKVSGSITANSAILAGGTYTGTHNFTGGTINVPTPSPGDFSSKAAPTEYVDLADAAKVDKLGDDDIEITDPAKGLILEDTVTGVRYRIQITSGVITASALP